MDFVLNLLKDSANAFCIALAAALAARAAGIQLKKGKRKNHPRRQKQKGGSRKQ